MSKRKKVWVTKFWRTSGVCIGEAEFTSTMDADIYGVPGAPHCSRTEFALARAEAIGQVKKKKAAKLASLRKQIAKIEAIDPEEAVPE